MEDLLRMEAVVLDCLSFRVNTPTAHTFLSMYKQALGVPPRTCALACYLLVSGGGRPAHAHRGGARRLDRSSSSYMLSPPRTPSSSPQELAMLEYELLHFRPSHLAAAAACLAQLYTTDMDGLRWGAHLLFRWFVCGTISEGVGGGGALLSRAGTGGSAPLWSSPPSCSHLPYVTNLSIDDLKPCMHRMLALQHEAYATTNVNSVFLPGVWLP